MRRPFSRHRENFAKACCSVVTLSGAATVGKYPGHALRSVDAGHVATNTPGGATLGLVTMLCRDPRFYS